MQDANDFDFIWPRLVIEDGMLLDPDAAATGKEVIVLPAELWMITQQVKHPGHRIGVGDALLFTPHALTVQKNVLYVALGSGCETNATLMDRHLDPVPRLAGTAREPFWRCPPSTPA